ncbi:MAG: hypothetical protein M1457_03470 [bacterium]|nr:hypothetical protein [bacterium]
MLVSDGERYRPVSHYMTKSLSEAMREAAALDRTLGERLKKSIIARLFGRRGRQFVMGLPILAFLKRTIKLREVFGGPAGGKLLRIAWGLARGTKLKDLLRRHTRCHGILRIIVLPFEEPDTVESHRLVECPAAFAYEHPLTRDIRFMPVCAWTIHKDLILRATAKRYGLSAQEEEEEAEAGGASAATRTA